MDRKEIFRQVLIELMNQNLLNEFISIIFDYDLTTNDFVYAQYKLIDDNITLNIFDNNIENRFNAYMFLEKSDINNICMTKEITNNITVTYIYLDNCYKKYLTKKTKPNIIKLALAFRVKTYKELNELIKDILPKEIQKIIYDKIKEISTE